MNTFYRYKTSRWREREIERLECTRETDKTLWVMEKWFFTPDEKAVERQRRKDTTGEHYHETWEDAHKWLLESAEAAVIAARRNLEVANSTLSNIKGMKKPEDA